MSRVLFVLGALGFWAVDVGVLYAMLHFTDCPDLFIGIGQGVILTYGIESYLSWLKRATTKRHSVHIQYP